MNLSDVEIIEDKTDEDVQVCAYWRVWVGVQSASVLQAYLICRLRFGLATRTKNFLVLSSCHTPESTRHVVGALENTVLNCSVEVYTTLTMRMVQSVPKSLRSEQATLNPGRVFTYTVSG